MLQEYHNEFLPKKTQNLHSCPSIQAGHKDQRIPSAAGTAQAPGPWGGSRRRSPATAGCNRIDPAQKSQPNARSKRPKTLNPKKQTCSRSDPGKRAVPEHSRICWAGRPVPGRTAAHRLADSHRTWHTELHHVETRRCLSHPHPQP